MFCYLFKVIYSFCAARYQMTHGPVRGPGVGDLWIRLYTCYSFWFLQCLFKRHLLCCVTRLMRFSGGTQCVVTSASDRQLQCVTQSEERNHTVTNQGSNPSTFNWRPLCLSLGLCQSDLQNEKQKNKKDKPTGTYRLFRFVTQSYVLNSEQWREQFHTLKNVVFSHH